MKISPPQRRRGAARRATPTITGLAATLIAAVLLSAPAEAGAAQNIGVAVTQVTGTAPFDPSPGPGKDTDATDNVVRSNDTVSYLVQLNVNDPGAGSSTATNVTVTQTLPAGMQWTRLPATCLTGLVVPPSQISPDGQTITCNIGDVPTGKAVTVTLSANVTEMTEGTVLTPAADSVSVAADLAPAATATPDPVVVTSIPRVDMVKSAPQVAATVHGGQEGYMLTFPVRVEIPNFGGRGLIGYEPPAAVMSLKEDYSNVSPNAEFVSCGPDRGGTWTCPAAGSPAPLSIGVNVADPNQIKSGTLSSTTVTIFVPKSDLVAAGGAIIADNLITDLVATDGHGNPAEGEIDTNNRVKVTLSLDPKTGFGIYKRYIDVTAPGRHVPGGSNVDRSGFSTVGVGQIFQAEVRVSASNAAAGYEQVASCDVFDGTSQNMTLLGPAASSSHGKGSPAWITANTVPGGMPLVQGTDFVIEYSSDSTSTASTDATRWAELAATGCTSGTWTSTPPATEAAANAVKRVRLRFIDAPPKQYSLSFAVNLAATSGADGTKIANFATYDVGAGWVPSTYNPETHKGSRGDRLILTAAQVKLAKDILVPVTPATGTPNVRPGEELKFGLRPTVFAPSQSVSPTVVTARDVVVTDILPAGMALSGSPGRAPSPAPASVTRNADGTTTIVWRLGTLTSNDAPSITYWAKVGNTAGGAKVNNSYVTSPDDVGSPAALITGTTDPHFAARTVTVDSLGGIQVEKEVITPRGEAGDRITFSITYANLDPIDRFGMDLIDVLPFNGDGAGAANVPGRSAPSRFHGAVGLQAVTGNDVDLIRYTDASPASVYALQDPSISGAGHDALPAGKAWCTADQITAGAAGCPKSIASSTAIRITRNEFLGANETATFSYSFDTPGSRAGDVYSNTAALRSDGLVLGTLSPTKTAKLYASRVGDFVWNDRNRNGRQDRGEHGVARVRVVLEGTDKRGRKVKVSTTTDARGRYLFTSATQAGQNAGAKDLVSGRYRIAFVKSSLPKGTVFTSRLAGPAGNGTNSKPYAGSGQTAIFDLADPSPDGVDGEDLSLDAGVVIPPPPARPVHRAPRFTG